MTVSTRIAQLRTQMQESSIDAWIVPSADPHLSEYLPEYWQQRQWLSGFTGSVGTLVVTLDFAGLWVDSRYWEQAEAQLHNSGIQLMRLGHDDVLSLNEWLVQYLSPEDTVGFNAQIMSLKSAQQLQQDLAHLHIHFAGEYDLLAQIWQDRPCLPVQAVYQHPATFVAQSRVEKLGLIRAEMQRLHAQYHFISALDDIAWILNLRGADVEFNPVFLAHLLITPELAYLFIDAQKISAEIRQALLDDQVELVEYERVQERLMQLPPETTMLMDAARITLGLSHSSCAETIYHINPSQLLKSQKSATDIAHVRQAMEQDGAALCEFFAWLEAALLAGERITELTIDEQICAARARQPHYVSPSFATIAGFNANGAMPHYRATAESHAVIEGEGLLLIDSGGQYFNGTTDITRVVPIGSIREEHRFDFTTVLKGMIQLSCAQFPVDFPAPLLDPIARSSLWANGLEYGHGTGHGVGYFLNVHEGPQVISYRAASFPHTQMKVGMITSNEPGVYRPGKWGVRIENLVCNQSASQSEFVSTLQFETLTLCPIDTRCVIKEMLNPAEVDWLNAYHQEVYRRLHQRVSGAALSWLEERTAAI